MVEDVENFKKLSMKHFKTQKNILSEIKELLENPDSLKPASYTTDINTTIL
jgi:hypothetical protein